MGGMSGREHLRVPLDGQTEPHAAAPDGFNETVGSVSDDLKVGRKIANRLMME